MRPRSSRGNDTVLGRPQRRLTGSASCSWEVRPTNLELIEGRNLLETLRKLTIRGTTNKKEIINKELVDTLEWDRSVSEVPLGTRERLRRLHEREASKEGRPCDGKVDGVERTWVKKRSRVTLPTQDGPKGGRDTRSFVDFRLRVR